MKKILFLMLALCLPLLLAAKTTVIYHTSDSHGFYYPKDGVGGFAALAAVVKTEKKPFLLLDSGDYSNGTVEAKNSKGLKSIELMNALGYHAATIGNHEFDFKDAAIEPMAQAAKFPFVAANFYDKETDQQPLFVKPYQIFHIGGVKYAVIGMGKEYPSKMYKFKQASKTLEKTLEKLETEKPNVVVVIAHDSMADNRHGDGVAPLTYLTKTDGKVNIVLGGHAHKNIQNEYHNGILFAEPGCYLKGVTKITVKTDDKTGQFVSAKSEYIPLEIAKTGEDKKVSTLAESLREPGVDVQIGSAAETLFKQPVVKGHLDSPLNNWVADVGRRYAGVDLFIHNNGGTRVDMQKGPLARRDVIDIHPFDNTITKVSVSGQFLKNFIKKNLKPSLYTYSGLTLTYKAKGKKVKDLQILINGKPIENKKTYLIATNSYIAGGGSEGKMFKKIPDDKKEQVGDKTIRQLIEEELTKGPVIPPATGRMLEF